MLLSAPHNVAAKLTRKFHGPFRINKVLSSVVYELVDLDGNSMGKIHVKDLKPYYVPTPR